MKLAARFWIFCLWALAVSSAVAHEGQPHEEADKSPLRNETQLALEKINQAYLQDIKPIFQKKCFDCHSSQTKNPWYRNLPGAKQLIDHDLKEAKEHLDMYPDFPFQSHASPLEDLEAIAKSVKENEMPPLRSRIMHPRAALSDEEKNLIFQWVKSGQDLLTDKN